MTAEKEKKATDEELLAFAKAVRETNGHIRDATTKMFKQGLTAKDAMKIDPAALENIYAQAYRLYNTGKYVEASHIFRLLVLMNAMEPKYMLGFAACFHMLKEYENAAHCYTLCSTIDSESPIPYYHVSDCYSHIGDKASSIISLEMAIERAGSKPEFAKLKERSQLTLKTLKKELKDLN